MKTLIIACLIVVCMGDQAQNTTDSYTNSSTNTTPGNQSQPQDMFNGTNPTGVPNQNNNYTIAPSPGSSSTSPGINPINPGSLTPVAPPGSYPASPGIPPRNYLVQMLYQDPMRTPKSPKQAGPVTTVDGSSGKYRSEHHVTPARKNGFTSHHRTRSAKPRHVSREKAKSSRTKSSQ